MNDKDKAEAENAKKSACCEKSPLKLKAAKKMESGQALQELVSKKKILPACESSCACSRPGRQSK